MPQHLNRRDARGLKRDWPTLDQIHRFFPQKRGLMRLILTLTAIGSRVFDYAFVNRLAFVDVMDVLAHRDGVLIAHSTWVASRLQVLPFCERHTFMQPDTATIEGDCPITGHREAKRNDNPRRALAYYVTEQAVSTAKNEEDVLAKENAP